VYQSELVRGCLAATLCSFFGLLALNSLCLLLSGFETSHEAAFLAGLFSVGK